MSISEQVKHLKELSDAAKANVYSFEALSQSLREAADTIEALSAKLQAADMEQTAEDCGGWIPCKERLPEYDTCVLVQVNGKYKNITFENAIEFATYIKGEGWILETYPDWHNPNIIAWQPLPEPYHEP